MTRAHHVKKAQKDYPEHGIKKGEPYYWWQFRNSPKRYSKVPPKPSQLTQSEFLGAMYEIGENIQNLGMGEWDTPQEKLDDVTLARDSIVDDLRTLADETQEKFDNMPESLQQGDTGQLLEERVEQCGQMADDLENVDLDLKREEGETDEKWAERIEDACNDLGAVSYGGG